jgi:hypothetical protein
MNDPRTRTGANISEYSGGRFDIFRPMVEGRFQSEPISSTRDFDRGSFKGSIVHGNGSVSFVSALQRTLFTTVIG